jgi:hypothetical protein
LGQGINTVSFLIQKFIFYILELHFSSKSLFCRCGKVNNHLNCEILIVFFNQIMRINVGIFFAFKLFKWIKISIGEFFNALFTLYLYFIQFIAEAFYPWKSTYLLGSTHLISVGKTWQLFISKFALSHINPLKAELSPENQNHKIIKKRFTQSQQILKRQKNCKKSSTLKWEL